MKVVLQNANNVSLTECLVSISRDVDFVFGYPVLGPGDLLHSEDLGFAELRVVEEEHPALSDGQVVFGPFPKLSQVRVVQGIEGIVPGRTNNALLNQESNI